MLELALSWLPGSSVTESFRKSPRARLEVVGSVDEISPVLRALANRLTAAIGRPVARARRALTETLRPSGVAAGFVADMFRTRDELLAENAAFRQQLVVASRKTKKPEFRGWASRHARMSSTDFITTIGGLLDDADALGSQYR